MIEIYPQPACGPCIGVKGKAKSLGLDHKVFDVTQDPDAYGRLLALGYTGTPVTVNTATGDTGRALIPTGWKLSPRTWPHRWLVVKGPCGLC